MYVSFDSYLLPGYFPTRRARSSAVQQNCEISGHCKNAKGNESTKYFLKIIHDLFILINQMTFLNFQDNLN